MKLLATGICFWFFSIAVFACADSTRVYVKLDALADGFYVYSRHQSKAEKLYSFLYNYNRNRQISLNHAWLRLRAGSANVRSNFALQTGTYVQDNYADEPDWAKVLLEANVGFTLNQTKTIWLDVGIIPSHIGFEGAGTLTNWALTRSLIAENSPYYLTGAKLSWTPASNWQFAVLGFNGWQRIYQSGKVLPAVGWQISHQRINTVFNWSAFMGAVQAETLTAFRYFNNVYYQVKLTPVFSLIADLDVGIQRHPKHYAGWWGTALLARYQVTPRLAATARAGYYADKQGLVTKPANLVAASFSFNADYKPTQAVLLRAELRRLASQKPLDNNQPQVHSPVYFTLAILAQVNVFTHQK